MYRSAIIVSLLFFVSCASPTRPGRTLLKRYQHHLDRLGGPLFLSEYVEDYEFNSMLSQMVTQNDRHWIAFGCQLLDEASAAQKKKLERRLVRAISKRRLRKNPKEILFESCRFSVAPAQFK